MRIAFLPAPVDALASPPERPRTGIVFPTRIGAVLVALSIAWAVAFAEPASGQPQGRPARIGLLCAGQYPILHPGSPYTRPLTESLRDLGFIEGRNLVWDQHGIATANDQLPLLARELVARNPDLILTCPGGAATTRAAKDATRTIPVVMMGAPDAVEHGLVESLGRPGGNVTGTTVPVADLALKQIQLLREIEPGLKRVVLFTSPGRASTRAVDRITASAGALGVRVQAAYVEEPGEIDRALAALPGGSGTGLIVPDDSTLAIPRRKLFSFSVARKIPLVAQDRSWATGGALFSYGPHYPTLAQRTASLIQKIILQGAKPSALPVEEPTRYELVVNSTMVKALGLTVPQSVLVRADEVVE